MKIITNRLPKNLMEITAELSILEMAPFYHQTIEELSKDIEIPGWRKGKAPAQMIKQKIGEAEINRRVAEIAIEKKYPEIVKEVFSTDKENGEPAGVPQIQIQKMASEEPFIFNLIIPLVPEVKLGNYKKIKQERKKIEITDEEIKKVLAELQQSRRQETLANRPAGLNDRIEIDLDLFIDKVPVENGQIKNFSIILGRDDYLPGLSENLKGLARGEEKNFSFPYPDSHYDKKLAGKLVDFKAKIKNVYQITLPVLDDVFAQSFGNFKTLKDLENKIKENLEIEAKNKEEQRLEAAILKSLVAQSKIGDIPEILVEHELDKMVDELKAEIELSGAKFEDYLQSIKKTQTDLRKDFAVQAQERIKTALCIRQLAKQENFSVKNEEIEEEIKRLNKIYEKQEQILDEFKKENGKIFLKNLLTNRKVIEWLKKQLD